MKRVFETEPGIYIIGDEDRVGNLLVMNKDEAVTLWNEFKTHSFRRDDEQGDKAYQIMNAVFDLVWEKK